MIERVLLLVMDGCGAGTAPDAELFGDTGANRGNTLVNVARAVGGLKIPTLRRLGLGNALDLEGGAPGPAPIGSFGRLQERSMGGKDTVTGHWEMMGILVDRPFPTYPDGFPADLVAAFEKAIGVGVLGNYPASGTDIIRELGPEHIQTGRPILYTSADSVFQVACHEDIVPIERLYEICRSARGLLQGEHAVQRVIARPFEGEPGAFRRTERRKDFPLEPPTNVLDHLAAAGVRVAGVGVVPEVFGGRGFAWSRRTQSNQEHYQATLEAMQTDCRFVFTNFEDFDMLYGHRQDAPGFARALETFDGYLEDLLGRMQPTDLLILTADHGNDPTTPSTDHAREYAPLLLYSPSLPGGRNYGTRGTFADLAATLAQVFQVPAPPVGESLLV
jgi:phosphopentomutase